VTLKNQLGQKMGRKGQITRRRIVERTRSLIAVSSYNELNSTEVAREAGVSVATFYTYYKDLDDLLLDCVMDVLAESDSIFEALKDTWSQAELPLHMARFVEHYMDYWDRHRYELRILCIESDRGKPQFIRLRVDLSNRIIEALGSQFKKSRPSLTNHYMLASVIYTSMERLASLDQNMLASFANRELSSGLHVMTREAVNAAIADILVLIGLHSSS
jgi:AcrR family transcriptional regulator